MENIENNNKLWFKAKRFGIGWYPSSWQGFAVLVLYTISTIFHFLNVDRFSHSASDTILSFIIPFIINTLFLLIICYIKGEKLKWRWGEK